MHSKFTKRLWSAVLAFAMILSTFSFGAIFASAAEPEKSKTDAEIIAGAYELTTREKALLSSGYLIGATHTYKVPDATDNLIEIDVDSKTITADSYEGTSGYKWVPVSAVIEVSGDKKEDITSFTNNKATYTYAGDAFAVKVKYQVSREIDLNTQKEILSAPTYLQQAMQVMDKLSAARDKLGTMEMAQVVDIMKQMNTAAGYPVKITIPGSSLPPSEVYLTFQGTKTGDDAIYIEKDAAAYLLSQIDSNSGKLNASVIMDEYNVAAYKIEYIINNADRIKKDVIDTYEYLVALTGPNAVLQTVAEWTPEGDAVGTLVKSFLADLNSAKASLNEAKAIADSLASAKAVVKTGLSADDYDKLDDLVLALVGELKGAAVTPTNPLVVDSTEIQYNMAMFDVNVKVVLKTANGVTGSTDLTTFDTKTIILTLGEGATKADIEQAVSDSGIESSAVSAWTVAGKYVDGKFNATPSTLPATLTEDIDYVVTYAPVTYELKYLDNDAIDVPYGYILELEKHSDSSQAYDYTVNSSYYAQGSKYTVVSNTTVTRNVGKAYTDYTVNGLVSGLYFGSNVKGQNILNSGALNIGNDLVQIRVPDNSTGIVDLDGAKLTANSYPSSYKNLDWAPYEYTVVSSTGNNTYKFNGVNTVNITEASFDRVDVTYRLTLTDLDDAYVLSVAQLPAKLVSEANTQMNILNTLKNNLSAMGQVDRATLNAVLGVVNGDTTMSPEIRTQIAATLDGIINNCIDTNGYLKIYNMISQYNADGLRYYYLNSAAIKAEIGVLAGYLNTLMGDGTNTELRDALITLLNSSPVLAGYIDKIDQLDELKAYMNNAKDIPEANAAINLTDPVALGKLANALESAGEVATVSTVSDLYLDSVAISVNAENTVTITASVAKDGGAPIAIKGESFTKGHILQQSDIEKIIGKLTVAIAELGVDDKYYNTDYLVSELQALVGQDVAALTKTDFNYTWTPKTFTVTVEGMTGSQTISIDNLEIQLPASTDASVRYEYLIDGGNVTKTSYTFTLAQIDTLFVGGTYNVERNEIDVSEEDLLKFVNELNAAIGNDSVVFALTKNASGKYAIVMKLNAANTTELPTAVKGMATKLATSYPYIAFADKALVYADQGTKVSIQAVIDTIMESSFGTEALKALIDANGNISSIALPGTVISDKAMTVAGGQLAQTKLVLGNSSSDVAYEVDMYITLGSAPSYLTELRNLMADQLAPYFDFKCENGKINVGLNLPQKAYEAYLAVLLVSDYADIADVNSINEDVALGFMMDIIQPLLSSSASASSVQNTLAKFGYNIDLVKYNEAFEAIRKFYQSTTFSYNTSDSTYDADANVSIKGFIDSMNLDSVLAGMIAEIDTGLAFSVGINLDNLDKDYEALYFDIGAAGVTNKFGLVEDLSAKLGEIAGTAVVILLNDVNADLTFNTTAVLNLNGKKVNGNITGTQSLRIIDTIIDSGVVGYVTGTISGNVKIAGGKYDADVSAFLTEGYAQGTDKVVENNFFTLVKEADGSISVQLNAGMLMTNKLPDVRTLAVDIVAEILANGFTANKLLVDGYKIYEITVDDLIGIYTGTDRVNTVISKIMDMISVADLKALANNILADITDFDAMNAIMAGNIAGGTDLPLLSYQITTGTWGFSLDYVPADDSITASVVSKGNNVRALNIFVTGEAADKQHFANLLGILADTTDASLEINTATGNKIPGGINFEFGVSGDIKIDFSSDPKYAVMIGVITADGLGAPANAELVAGLKAYFETNNMQDLANAFNKLTVAQIFTAIKNDLRGDSFAAMLTNLGLNGYSVADAIALEAETGAFIKLLGVLLRRVDVTGTSTPLGAFVDSATGAYTVDKQNIKRTFTANVGEYTFVLNAELVDFFASVKIFGDTVTIIDYSELQNQITRADALNRLDYTKISWDAMQLILTSARDALTATTQGEVDAAALALKNAIDALVAMDRTELEAQITAAEALNESDWTPASWADMQTALASAILARESCDQAEVNAAATALKNAIDALVEAVNYDELNYEIGRAELYTDPSIYTPESWTAMQNALTAARAALTATTQGEVDAAALALKNAIDALELLPNAVDYAELIALIARAEQLDEKKYTAESWAAIQTALTAARAALTSDDQEVVNAAAAALRDAMARLTAMYYGELYALIMAAGDLVETDYTADSWAKMVTAWEAAGHAMFSRDQDVVDAAAKALKDAIAALVKVNVPAVDYTELNAQIAAAEKLTEADYTPESWAAMKVALAAAKAALTSNDQATVNAAALALKNAIAALVKVTAPAVDYTELNAAIEAAEKLNQNDYTSESWADLKFALAAAKTALTSTDQATVNTAAQKLREAIAALVKAPTPIDYSELNKQITAAEALKEADYTADSWAAMQTALTAARAALSATTQADVDAAATALKNAIAALVKATVTPTVNYDELNAQIAAAEALKEADYTAESWTAMQTALTAAKAALTSTVQADVDAAATALKNAIAALVKVTVTPPAAVDYTELNAQIAAAEALKEADYTAESWTAMQTALTAAKAALTSNDQAEVDAAAAALKTAIEALEAQESGSSLLWLWIVLAIIIVIAAAVIIFIIIKKKKGGDNTPLVDYDISDDN